MKTVVLRAVTRHDPDDLPAALRAWLGASVAVTTRREGDDLVVTLTGPAETLDARADQVIRFYLCWRRATHARLHLSRSGGPLQPRVWAQRSDGGEVDPAAASFVPSATPPRR